MKISCEEATKICTKTQYAEASFIERIKLNLHLLRCKACSAFSVKNNKLSTLCSEAKLNGLSVKDKEAMKRCMEEQGRNPH